MGGGWGYRRTAAGGKKEGGGAESQEIYDKMVNSTNC